MNVDVRDVITLYLTIQMATYTCRFCLEESTRRQDFIVPCRCSGTQKYIHRHCLDSWRSQNINRHNFTRCNTCHFQYELEDNPIPDDPKINQKRDWEYYKAVGWDIGLMVLSVLVLFTFFILLLWILEKARIFRVSKFSEELLGVRSTWLSYFMTATILLIFVAGFNALLSMEYGLYQMPAIGLDTAILILAFPFVSMTLIFSFCLLCTIYNIITYVSNCKSKHYRRIWGNLQVRSRPVRDFGEEGPPPLRPNERAEGHAEGEEGPVPGLYISPDVIRLDV